MLKIQLMNYQYPINTKNQFLSGEHFYIAAICSI
jgi:hypothetical protein